MGRLTGVLLAAAMALSSMATTTSPAWAEVNETNVITPKAEKDFLDRTSYLIDLMNQANAAYGAFSTMSDAAGQQTDRQALTAYWREKLPHIREVRVVIKGLLAKVDALPRFQSSHGVYNDMAATMVVDTRNYLVRVDELLVATEDMVDAIVRDDRRKMEAVAIKLRRSIVVLIDGQKTVVKARQAMLSKDQSTWHVMGIYSSLYIGMGVIARVALSDADTEVAAAELRAAAGQARVYARNGRARVAVERTAPGAIKRVSDLDIEALNIGDQLADRLDRLAADLTTSDDPGAVALAALKDLAVLEEREMAITGEQLRVINSTGA